LTGEDGIMPGDKVHVGMQLTDSSFAGNEVADTTADFNWDVAEEAEKPLTADNPESSKAKPARRRAPRRKAPETPAMSECGACGADLAMDAKECGTCGAKFE
jgi:hypothetical protein